MFDQVNNDNLIKTNKKSHSTNVLWDIYEYLRDLNKKEDEEEKKRRTYSIN